MNELCIRATVSGKVQGVFFRDSAKKKADELGLTGWVKNLPNGDVDVFACGERDPLMLLTEWLWEGSAAAEVSNVHWEEQGFQSLESFESQGG